MSGRIRLHGSTATIRRAAVSRSLGGATNQAWADASTGVAVLFDTPDPATVQRATGQETRVAVHAFAEATVDIVEKDGLIITAGWKSGERFHVEAVVGTEHGRSDRHKELSLISMPAASFA